MSRLENIAVGRSGATFRKTLHRSQHALLHCEIYGVFEFSQQPPEGRDLGVER
jgi:hypothetical protein